MKVMSDKVERREDGGVTVTFDEPHLFQVEWDDYRMPPEGSWIIDKAIKSSGAKNDSEFTHCYVYVSAVELVKWEEGDDD
jgi:hypothetical protein